MECNREAAEMCVAKARAHLANGRLDAAIKLAKKSIHLFPLREADLVLKEAAAAAARGGGSGSSRPASGGGSSRPSTSSQAAGGKTTSAPKSPPARKFSKKQQDEVVRILAAKSYYEVLKVERSASTDVIKRAYKKACMKVHPDKNGAPRAEEAFKAVSNAHTCLTDDRKRAIYDQTGSDSPQPQVFRRHARHPDDFVDIFDLFGFGFGGQPGMRRRGHPFAQAQYRQQRYQQQRRRQQQQQQQQQGGQAGSEDRPGMMILLQFLPILLLLLFTVMPSTGSSGSTSRNYAFQRNGAYSIEHSTRDHGVPYYVDEDFDLSGDALSRFEGNVHKAYVANLRARCQWERHYKDEVRGAAGAFSGADRADIEAEAERLTMPSCDMLNAKSYRAHH